MFFVFVERRDIKVEQNYIFNFWSNYMWILSKKKKYR